MQVSAKAADSEDPFLVFCLEELFPWTLDVLADSSPHINEMAEQLQSSLNLIHLMNRLFKRNSKFEDFKQNQLR